MLPACTPAMMANSIATMSAAQPSFGHLDQIETLVEQLKGVEPELFFQRFGRPSQPLIQIIFATAIPALMDCAVQRLLEHYDAATITSHVFLPFNKGMLEQDALEVAHRWNRLFGAQSLSQSQWFTLALWAHQHKAPKVLDWVVGHPTFWHPNEPLRVLDAIDQLARLEARGPLRQALITAITYGWSLIEAADDQPDARLRHTPALWAMGIVRTGWTPPTMLHFKLFRTIHDHTTSSKHRTLRFVSNLGAWEDWVGLGTSRAEHKLWQMTET